MIKSHILAATREAVIVEVEDAAEARVTIKAGTKEATAVDEEAQEVGGEAKTSETLVVVTNNSVEVTEVTDEVVRIITTTSRETKDPQLQQLHQHTRPRVTKSLPD